MPLVSKLSKWLIPLSAKRTSNPSTLVSSRSEETFANVSCREKELIQVFRHLDANGDNRISGEELGLHFASLGEPLSEDELSKVIQDFDGNGDSQLEFNEFVQLVGGGGKEQEEDDLRHAFNMYESDSSPGFITPLSLQKMLGRLGDAKSLDQCVKMIDSFDLDKNGKLDFQEFRQMTG